MIQPGHFLATYPEPIAGLGEHLRCLVKEAVPGAFEAVYIGWRLIGYRRLDGAGSRYFCFIAPFDDRVALGFEWGALLTAPRGITLTGSGKQVRQVLLRPGGAIPKPQLEALVREASELSLLPQQLLRERLGVGRVSRP